MQLSVAMSLKSRLTLAVRVSPARLPVIACVTAPPSDQDAKRQRVRPFAETCGSGKLTV